MSETSPPPEVLEDDAFYVGYLPLPREHRRFVFVIIPALLWTLVAIGFVIVWPRRSAGDGVWETGKPIERTGLLVATPYPMLLGFDDASEFQSGAESGSADAAIGSARVTLLTEMGKRGALARATPHDGRIVTVTGYRLHRDGREILELVPDEDAITPAADQRGAEALARAAGRALSPPSDEAGRVTTRRGEILDSKCYLGAMKPGDGKQHKACAMLCIRGGIPPLLFGSPVAGSPGHALVLDVDGGRIDDGMISLAGEPVMLTGSVGRVGDLDVFFVSGRVRDPG
ncbi:MAG: hypothetical protein KF838_04215 [Phycisphaeraceae bacterium]|nr:MAG: hypothetical protein KF838_04215 [Phycisphaeraceae bacterium]